MQSHILGYPSIGSSRELKFALEDFWAGKTSFSELKDTAEKVRLESFSVQQEAGLTYVAAGDFSLYDRMLDTMCMLGLVPRRYTFHDMNETETYFAMARGDALRNLRALPMKKWFDTNYHYIVPEPDIRFRRNPDFSKLTNEVVFALKHGYNPKAVLIGPVTFLALSSLRWTKNRWELMEDITGIYCEAIKCLPPECGLIQIDEPILGTELEKEAWLSFIPAHRKIKDAASGRKLMLATYFGDPLLNLTPAYESGYDIIHLDMTSSKHAPEKYICELPAHMSVSAGVVNGRNIWKPDRAKAAGILRAFAERLGEDRVMAASSCSLLHSPVDLEKETALDETIRSKMSFAVQKCSETAELAATYGAYQHSACTEETETGGEKSMPSRKSPYSVRRDVQNRSLNLPFLPTTTIGSFPQTQHIRALRRRCKSGEITQGSYENAIRQEIYSNIQHQLRLGLDVLVHGEPERSDMAEYFGENFGGFCFTQHGWVQSYGSRCVKPPVIHADVNRIEPVTLRWIKYAASLTDKPVKAILTGPVTIAKWSFMREDIPQERIWEQIAIALRDEVNDLAEAGIKIIQIDEPAFAEAMPLTKDRQDKYFDDAVYSFRLTVSDVDDDVQIHTHMCYSEFGDIMPHVKRLDADVISIEASRSGMEILDSFRSHGYESGVGAGIYDIHSSRIPSVTEMSALISRMSKYIPAENIRINPDCGLKTRGWPETLCALQNMVTAAVLMREKTGKKADKKAIS